MPIVLQSEGWYEDFRHGFEGAISAAGLKTRTVVCQCPSLALDLAW